MWFFCVDNRLESAEWLLLLCSSGVIQHCIGFFDFHRSLYSRWSTSPRRCFSDGQFDRTLEPRNFVAAGCHFWSRRGFRCFMHFCLNFAQVEVLFLPKYSPELNPCENVFGMVKTFIRNERGRGHFVHELVRAFQSVTWEKVRASYRSCVQLWLRIQQPDPCTVCNCFKKEILPKTNLFPYEKSALAALENFFCFCRAFSIFEHKFLFVPIPTGQFVVPQL